MRAENPLITSITLPSNAGPGQKRIVIDGIAGTITGYYADNVIAWQLDVAAFNGFSAFADTALPGSTLVADGIITLGAHNTLANLLGTTRLLLSPSGQLYIWMTDNTNVEFKAQFQPTTAQRLAIIPFAEFWQTVANGGLVLNAGWATNAVAGGAQPLQFRVDAEDNLVIKGICHSTSATPSATLFTLTGFFVPKVLQRAFCMNVAAGQTDNRINISSVTGNVTLATAVTAANVDVYFDVSVPLGNIP